MKKLVKSHQYSETQVAYRFHCPGCECSHFITVPNWTWNGSEENPTVTPSILVNGLEPRTPQMKRCHSFITDGKIRFLQDCEHELAGQTVELPSEE